MPITNIKGDETAVIKRYYGDFSVSRVNTDFENYYVHCNNNVIEISKMLSKDELKKILQIRLYPSQNKFRIASENVMGDVDVEQYGKKLFISFAVDLGHFFGISIEQSKEKKYHFKMWIFSITDKIFHYDTTEVEFDFEFPNPDIICEEW